MSPNVAMMPLGCGYRERPYAQRCKYGVGIRREVKDTFAFLHEIPIFGNPLRGKFTTVIFAPMSYQ